MLPVRIQSHARQELLGLIPRASSRYAMLVVLDALGIPGQPVVPETSGKSFAPKMKGMTCVECGNFAVI
jgi:hypothetical protein